MHSRVPFAFVGVLLIAAAPPFDAAVVDDAVQTAMKAWQVPGAALAIVKGDEVVFEKGFGVRELGASQPVTIDTLFPIASCSKAFTATAIAMLVDEGKIAWDDPVRKHVEFFHLADPLADAYVTLRDLLCHRTGLSRHDWLWIQSSLSRETLIRKLALVPATHSFRSTYQYQNIMYATAGYAAGAAAKSNWEALVRQRLFEPLKMTTADCSVVDMQKNANYARPHDKAKSGEIKRVPIHNIDSMAPAGGINANVHEMTHWVRLQLADGMFGGKRVVSKKNLDETHTPQMFIRLEGREKTLNPESTYKSYGLGWIIQDYRGQRMISHTGGLDGYRSRVVLLPDHKLGIVVLTNSSIGTSGASMHMAVTNTLADILLNSARRDWNAYYTEQMRLIESRDKEREKERQSKRHKDSKPSRELTAYAGPYDDPAYGKAEIIVEKDSLYLNWSSFRKELRHFHYDTFTVVADDDLENEQVLFELNRDGEVATLRFLERSFHRAKEK